MFLRVLALCGIFFAYFLGGAFAESSIWGLALVANGPAKFALLTANVTNGHFTLVGNGTAHPELAVCVANICYCTYNCGFNVIVFNHRRWAIFVL